MQEKDECKNGTHDTLGIMISSLAEVLEDKGIIDLKEWDTKIMENLNITPAMIEELYNKKNIK